MAGLQRQQLLMSFGEALSGPGAGWFLREAMQQQTPEGIRPGPGSFCLSSLCFKQETHRCKGIVAPALSLDFMAAVGHQQGSPAPLVRVRGPAVHSPKLRGGNSRGQYTAVGAQKDLAGAGCQETDSRCGQQQPCSGPGSRAQTINRILLILKLWP